MLFDQKLHRVYLTLFHAFNLTILGYQQKVVFILKAKLSLLVEYKFILVQLLVHMCEDILTKQNLEVGNLLDLVCFEQDH